MVVIQFEADKYCKEYELILHTCVSRRKSIDN